MVTVAAASLVLWHVSAATAIPASPNEGAPQQTTHVVGDAGGFFIAADVSYDPAFGPWVKELDNVGAPILSGEDVPLFEMVTNTGDVTWTGWHEGVVSTTFIGIVIPGFLFRAGSLVLSRDGDPLVEGVDYTVTPTVHTASGDPGGNFGNWEAVSISFTPSGEIAPGQTLTIEKSIFEVFLDANIWTSGEAAVIEQYPTVSATRVPAVGVAGNLLLALGMAGFGGRALKRRRELGRHTR
jgi:hypothetical protein